MTDGATGDNVPYKNDNNQWSIKRCHFILDHNSHVSWWMFTILLPTETGMNALCGSYKMYNLPPTVSPHYLLKVKPHKQRILKSVVTVFHYSTEEWVCVWDKWAVFLQEVFKMSALLGNSFSSLLTKKNILHFHRFSTKILSSNSACFILTETYVPAWRLMWHIYGVKNQPISTL